MGLFRLIGLFAIIPATVLLTISFFVLFTLRKIEAPGLKAFGYVIAALLWLCALLVLSAGAYTIATGRHPMMGMMQEMICQMKQEKAPHMIIGAPMPGMMQQGK